MNETEICKAVVKSVFSSHLMPNLGLIDNFDKKELIIRNYLWNTAGFNVEESTQRFQHK